MWPRSTSSGTEESIARLQQSLVYAMPYALGMFEPSAFEQELIADGVFEGEAALREQWIKRIEKVIAQTSLRLPDLRTVTAIQGGRTGKHSEHLQPLLDEMSEVFRIDPSADW